MTFDPDTQGALDATRVHLKTIKSRLLEVCSIAHANADVKDYLSHAFSDWQYQVQGSLDEVAYVFDTAAEECYQTWSDRRQAVPDNDWWANKQHALQEGYFDIDGQFGPLRGLHNPWHRWNGWATPWFPLESVERIQLATDSVEQRFTIDLYRTPPQVWLWNKEYADEYDDDRGRLEASMVVDGVTLYDIGQGGWCWDEVTKDGDLV